MNNELQTDLQTKVWQWIESSAQAIGDFAVKEIPPFIHEYLQWKFYDAAFDAACRMIFVIIGLVMTCYFKKVMVWANKHADEEGGLSYLAVVVFGFVTGVFVLGAFPNEQLKDMVQIKVAPKVYLIEKAAEIIKNK